MPQVAPADLVTIADRLHAFVGARFGGATALREWPVHAEDGLQVLTGRLDLLVDLGDGYAIIDHKSFPGSVALDEERLRAFAGQVSVYARAIKRVTGRTRFEYWVDDDAGLWLVPTPGKRDGTAASGFRLTERHFRIEEAPWRTVRERADGLVRAIRILIHEEGSPASAPTGVNDPS